MKTKISFILLLLGCFQYIHADSFPEAITLLKSSTIQPDASYQGRLLISSWDNKSSKTQEIHVWFMPPNNFRWDYIKPDGAVEKTIISDGSNEHMHLISKGKLLKGNAAKSSPKQMTESAEWALLKDNYEISMNGSDQIAGHQTWVIELKPKSHGKPTQIIWIEKKHRAVLAIKRFLPSTNFAIQSQFTLFNIEDIPKNIFLISSSNTPIDHGYNPDFLSLEDVKNRIRSTEKMPNILPFGYHFESADIFDADKQHVYQYRFTDGLSSLSIFKTSHPARLSSNSDNFFASPAPQLQTSNSWTILHKKLNSSYLTIIGDVSDDTMKIIAMQLK